MTGVRLEYSSLSYFIQFFIDENENNILLLSLVNSRYAMAAASQQDLKRVELSVFCRVVHPHEGTLMKVWLISKDPAKTTEHYIQSYPEFLITIFSVRRLFLKRPDFVVAITISWSKTLIPWFSAKIAERSARILKEFFPSASFKLETLDGLYPIFKQFSPFIAELAPVLTNVRCSPKELYLLRNADLNTLSITESTSFKQRGWYYPELFCVKAKELLCECAFSLHVFTQGTFPIQCSAELFVCDLDFHLRASAGLYEDVFGEISRCLPNLRRLKCKEFGFGIDFSDDYERAATYDGNISRRDAIRLASWHVREIARLSHLETELELIFEFRTQACVNASAELFSKLLPGSSVCESYNPDLGLTQKHVTYHKNNTMAKLEVHRRE